MFRTKNTPVQITVPDYREPLSGVVTTAMPYGALVQYKNTGDARELVAANGGRCAILEQDVLTDADWQAHCKLDPRWHNEIRKPVPVGSAVSARFAHEAEFEGADYFTGINGSSTAGTLLKVAAGKFVAAGADQAHARLGRKITPHDPASFRWIVEFID
jgi:hypothetical protein